MKFNSNLVLAVLTAFVMLYFGYSQFSATKVEAGALNQCDCAHDDQCGSGRCTAGDCTVCVGCYPGGYAGLCEF